MYVSLRTRYHWRQMWTDARTHCLSCHSCQVAKKRPAHSHRAPLIPISQNENELFSCWHIDYLKMPPVNGFTKLLVATDSFSKWTEAFPVYTAKAEEACDILYAQIFSRFGAPRIIVGDRSKTWFSQLIKELCRKFE